MVEISVTKTTTYQLTPAEVEEAVLYWLSANDMDLAGEKPFMTFSQTDMDYGISGCAVTVKEYSDG